MNSKKLDNRFAIGVICVLIVISLFIPTIGNRLWNFNEAVQTEPKPTMVAYCLNHKKTSKVAYGMGAKMIEMTLDGKLGQLTLTDHTNGMTYKGTYFKIPFSGGVYRVKLDGKEGYAFITLGAPSMLTITLDDYCLVFFMDY